MADFAEWFDGAMGADEDVDMLAELEEVHKAERDAVLFLVDCHQSMFNQSSSPSEENDDHVTSVFSSAVHCALRVYQEKVITSDRDLVGFVLYNTKQRLNMYDFGGVYVFHEFDTPSAPRIQELQVLARSGSADLKAYNEFVQHIGHGDAKSALLSEALWAAQHLFHNLRSSSIAYRRIFLFTNNDDPCSGLPVERERCFARAKDLHDAGVALEVFGDGVDVVSSSPQTLSSSGVGGGYLDPSTGLRSTSPPSSSSHPSVGHPTIGLTAAPLASSHPLSTVVPPLSGSEMGTLPIGKPARAAAAPTAAGTGTSGGPNFLRQKFWEPLVLSPAGAKSSLGSLDRLPDANSDEYCGAVHVSSGLSSFHNLLSDIRLKTHPQRSTGSCEVRVGFGSTAPKFKVSIYVPILRCPKPKFRWLDGSTNAAVTTETRYLSKATGAELGPNELEYCATVGGSEVIFSKEETQKMREACSGPAGLTILGFKAQADAVKCKYSISRSAFLHCNAISGGVSALKFFVQLHRSLTSQRKVGIAELVSRSGAAPRLVALIPSAIRGGAEDSSVIVSGMGFHMVALPYADDIRSYNPPKPCPPRATDDQTLKAKKIIRKLSVDYDVMAIANPALQRQYQILQQLALVDPMECKVDDLTLPDVEGMKKVAAAFADFSAAVLPPTYFPENICPPPKPGKKPPTAAELKTIDFDKLEQTNSLDTLTMPYLQQYLRTMKEDALGAKLKHELVARVAEIVKKRRGIKREREED